MIPGQKYTATSGIFTVPASATDLFLLGAVANVPIYLHRVVATSGNSAVLGLQLLRRSTASTGGSSITPRNTSPAGPAASSTLLLNPVTTTGTGTGDFDDQSWNELAPYEFNQYPDGEIIVPGTFCALWMPTAPGSTFTAAWTIEFTEVK